MSKLSEEQIHEIGETKMETYVKQLIFEVGVDPIPTYNGIYDDNGNKIDILDIPVPHLCLTCESFLDDDWEENMLCNLSRAEKREEGEEFVCYAWRERENE